MEPKLKLFVVDIVSNTKVIKHGEEISIINIIKEKLNHLIIIGDTEEIKNQCNTVIREVTQGNPLKGNIRFFVESADNDKYNIEIVRAAHGGGNNQSKRISGGVAIATLIIVKIEGELSPIHGIKWYYPEERDPFAHLFT